MIIKKHHCFWFIVVLSITVFAGNLDNLPDFNPDANMSRDDIPDIFKWNLKDLCESDTKWNEEIKQCQQELESINEYHPNLNTAKGINKYLEAFFSLDEKSFPDNRITAESEGCV